jgi:hypothetical protein
LGNQNRGYGYLDIVALKGKGRRDVIIFDKWREYVEKQAKYVDCKCARHIVV